jgi:hypothetical protein
MKLTVPAAILAGLMAFPGVAPAARVLLDRLTWSPDGNHLAVEATLESGTEAARDTLIVDLSRGGVAMRTPHPFHVAFDEARRVMVVAARYAILVGSSASPESLRVLAALNPARDAIDRVAFSAGGDTVLVMSHPPDRAWYDIAATSLADGRSRLLDRLGRPADADSVWARRSLGREPVTVSPVPFSTVYLPVGGAVFHLERSDRGSPRGGVWLYDLHRRNVATGEERILARAVTVYATAVSPDSAWVALAGSASRPDYGGDFSRTLWVSSADGSAFYTVHREGTAAEDTPVSAMTWHDGALWYLTPEGLFRLEPARGRSRPVRIGPAADAWSGSLVAPETVHTLILPDAYDDSTRAVLLRERLRGLGRPAWILGPRQGPFRVAVGGSTRIEDLESIAVSLSTGGFDDFRLDSLLAKGSNLPFPHGRRRSPDGSREAYLTEVGPPGWSAGELWISERHGARQVRLLRAMLRIPGGSGTLTGPAELPKVRGF